MNEKQIFEYIKAQQERENFFTVADIKKALGMRSTSSLYRALDYLEGKNLIRREKGKWGGISVNEAAAFGEKEEISIPLLGIVAAGNPIEAVLVPERVFVPPDMLKPGFQHFGLEVRGESMIEAHIFEKDKIIVRAGRNAENGDLVVALVDGRDATVKRFKKNGNFIDLIPANKEFQTITVDAARVTIQGIVVGLIRYYKS
jgi:repressor LexA